MAEPVTTLGLGAIAAYLGKDGLQKLLGPTADYLGGGLRDFTQKRVETIGRILKNASSKVGSKIDTPGQVPPKVLKAVLDEGSFSNDALAVEYFGGILASSRSESGRDDRGARIAKMLDALSTYQLRTHYLIYGTVRKLYSGHNLRVDMEGRRKMRLLLPFSGYIPMMEFSEQESKQMSSIFSHVFFGLHADNLLENDWQYGPKEKLMAWYPDAKEAGIVCQPSSLGIELFLWAFGHSDKPLEYVFDPGFSGEIEGQSCLVAGAHHVGPD